MTISSSTAASAGRFIAQMPMLNTIERTQILLALLEVAYAEGAQHIAHTIEANIQAAKAVQKARTQ